VPISLPEETGGIARQGLNEIIAAGLLGVLQGLTEFLPVSSSAHLLLVPWIFGWKPEGIAFDVALHVGTAVAVLAYFWKEWLLLAAEVTKGIRTGDPWGNAERRLAWYLLAGTLPAIIVGLLFEHTVERVLRSPLVTVVTLTLFGLILYAAERRSRQTRSMGDLRLADSLWIGLSQAVAVIPGVSRSGITISTALLRDTDRASAARFSFLLSTPVIVGAGLLEGARLFRGTVQSAGSGTAGPAWAVLVVGIGAASVTGFLCIRYFLRYLQTRTFVPFVIYRCALAIAVLAFFLQSRP
jgi:undecaprenyl-diphosphatase